MGLDLIKIKPKANILRESTRNFYVTEDETDDKFVIFEMNWKESYSVASTQVRTSEFKCRVVEAFHL